MKPTNTSHLQRLACAVACLLLLCPVLVLAQAPTPTAGSHSLVISQFYFGNNSTSTSAYPYSYVEIFNAGSQQVDLQNWMLVYSSQSQTNTSFGDSTRQWIGSIDPTSTACLTGCTINYSAAFTASNCNAAPLAGQYTRHCWLNPGQYMLIRVKANSATGSTGQAFPLMDSSTTPQPDFDLDINAQPDPVANVTINPSGQAGKYALINAHSSPPTCNYSSTYGYPLPPSFSSGATNTPMIVDLVGYGYSIPNCWENNTSQAAPSWNTAGSTDYSNGPVDFLNSTVRNRAAFVRTSGYAGPHDTAKTNIWDTTNLVPYYSSWNVTEDPCADSDNNASNFGPVNVGTTSVLATPAGTGMTNWVLHNSYRVFDVVNGARTYTPAPCANRSSAPPIVTVTAEQNAFSQAPGTGLVKLTINVEPSSNPVAIYFKIAGTGSDGVVIPGASTWTDGGWVGGKHVFTTTATVPTDTAGSSTITVNATDDAYRAGTGTVTINVNPGVAATMTSPAQGSTLAGSSASFDWAPASGAQGYWIWAGKTPGSMDYYNGSQGSNTTGVVNGLPVDGSVIYVRLFTQNDSGWQWNDYTYQAATPTKAAMISPASGTTLPGTSVTFNWGGAVAATRYFIWIGSSAGAMDIYNGDQNTNTSATISNLPANGTTVYVRLFTQVGGAWQYNDYTYAAASPTKAAMISPAAGTTLPGTSVTFNWGGAVAATRYFIWIGSSTGAMDIYNGDQNTNTSATISNLPANGTTVYVRLFTQVGGAWQYNDYTYTAASPSKAAMISPADGSTLPGSTVTFTWSAGVAAANYYLWVGSMHAGASDTDPARYNYVHQDAGLATTITASTLPTNGSTVYARLFTWVNGGWQWNDYTYTAASN